MLTQLLCVWAGLPLIGLQDAKAVGADVGVASTDEEVFAVITAHPRVLERPIFELLEVEEAVIGRPPSNVLELVERVLEQ